MFNGGTRRTHDLREDQGTNCHNNEEQGCLQHKVTAGHADEAPCSILVFFRRMSSAPFGGPLETQENKNEDSRNQ
jgi:hypothetical protein